MRHAMTCWAVLVAVGAAGGEQIRRPNLVILVADDHRASACGVYGSKLVRTPNLDQLAREGIRFDRAYCNAPICTPSRQSFLTGRYPHAVGVTLLQHALSEEAYTLAERLRGAGYRTGAFGKTHFNSDKLHGFEVHRTPEEFWRTHGRRAADRPLPAGVEVYQRGRPFVDPARVWLNSMGLPVGRYDDEMPESWYVRQAAEFMKAHRDEPFFIQMGFHQPHSPFQFPVDWPNRCNPQDTTAPCIGPEDVPQIPRVFASLSTAERQGIIASYLTAVAYLDSKVGQLLSAIDELRLRDNTVVVYLGDNGYHLGEHGRFEKHCLYENAVRVPLIMRFPERIRAGLSSAALVELVDIVPTVLDYLGVPFDRNDAPPRDLHGCSLRPLIEGQVPKVRDEAFSEYQHTSEAMVRTDRFKLIYRTANGVGDWIGYEEIMPPKGRLIKLFDVQADPDEYRNLAGDSKYADVVSALLDKLADWYRRIPPVGEPPPANLSREAFLDWAIPPREAGPVPR